MTYKHIVFDVDGTLINTEQAVLCSLRKTVKQIKNEEIDLSDLRFALGITSHDTLLKLGFTHDIEIANQLWNENMHDYFSTIHIFDGIKEVLHELKKKSFKLGIITSKTRSEYTDDFLPFGLADYFDTVICASDTKDHKPNPAPMHKYLETGGINADEVLYIGDSLYDMQCALNAGVDFGLALWGCASKNHMRATYYFDHPLDVLNIENQVSYTPWLRWAMELQFIGQAGLTYSHDDFDRERFARIREISAEMLSTKTGLSIDLVTGLFCNEVGFQTPKLDTRAAIIENGKILLVKEKLGRWSLPGGWVDVLESIKSNTIKEVMEEAGLNVIPYRLVALHDRNKHNLPPYAYGVCKAFILCKSTGGSFTENIETEETGYFSFEDLPPLAEEKNNKEQIKLCFDAYRDEYWEPIFD